MRPRALLRPLLVWSLAIPYLCLAVALGFLLSPVLGRRRAFWTLAPSWLRQMAAAFGIRRSLRHWDSLPLEIQEGLQPAIFLANHTSLFDPPLIISTLPSRPVFIAKRELARVPVLGWIIWLAGFIFIDRQVNTRALDSLRKAAERIRKGQSIAAFPEGTRTRTGSLLPFKRGIFNLAFEAGVPVVPMAIHGGFHLLPPGTWRVNPGPYCLSVGCPLHPSEFDSPEALRESAEKALLAQLQQGL